MFDENMYWIYPLGVLIHTVIWSLIKRFGLFGGVPCEVSLKDEIMIIFWGVVGFWIVTLGLAIVFPICSLFDYLAEKASKVKIF